MNLAEPDYPVSAHPLFTLRAIVPTDIASWSAYLNLPAVYEHTSWCCPAAEELMRHVWNPSANASAGILRFAIATRSHDLLVGTIGYHSIDSTSRRAEIAYDLEPTMWGKGIATVMCRTIVKWAFSRLGFRTVDAAVLDSNTRSIKVLQNAGFNLFRVAPDYRMVRGTPGRFLIFRLESRELAPDSA